MSGDDLLFLALAVGWMTVTWSALEWWFRARTIWLSRLGARGLLAGSYSPAPANLWLGGLKWTLRHRITVADVVRAWRLENKVDEDRVSEVWRIRMKRRRRAAVAVGVGGLALVGFASLLYESLGWLAIGGLVVVLGAAALVPGRGLFRRVRDWGDYGADLI
jgi:hypothetical protein